MKQKKVAGRENRTTDCIYIPTGKGKRMCERERETKRATMLLPTHIQTHRVGDRREGGSETEDEYVSGRRRGADRITLI